MLLFGVEPAPPPPPPPPPLTAEQQLEIQVAREKESEEKFQSMISELQMSVDDNKEFANSASKQMASFDKRLLTLGQVSIDAIVMTQKRVMSWGPRRRAREERDRRDREGRERREICIIFNDVVKATQTYFIMHHPLHCHNQLFTSVFQNTGNFTHCISKISRKILCEYIKRMRKRSIIINIG